jgi:hypothetical protein
VGRRSEGKCGTGKGKYGGESSKQSAHKFSCGCPVLA